MEEGTGCHGSKGAILLGQRPGPLGLGHWRGTVGARSCTARSHHVRRSGMNLKQPQRTRRTISKTESRQPCRQLRAFERAGLLLALPRATGCRRGPGAVLLALGVVENVQEGAHRAG
eukprot:753038-Hanusia_phi.AAC.5